MSAHLWKIALVVTMTHGFRELGRRAGPRWGALALGMPCSTAVALLGRASDGGTDDAVTMAGSSLLGLIGAVALPVAFAAAIGRGWGLGRAVASGVAAYLALAAVASQFDPGNGLDSTVLGVLAVIFANRLAARLPVPSTGARADRVPPSMARTLALRTIVPVACLLASMALGKALGPGGAGLMSVFPGVTLMVLVLTRLESGDGSAIRMARALPLGNLGMVAFLSAFRIGCPELGLGWGTGLAYAASFLTLGSLVVVRDGRAWLPGWVSGRRGPSGLAPNPKPILEGWVGRRWPKAGRRFSPLIEAVAS